MQHKYYVLTVYMQTPPDTPLLMQIDTDNTYIGSPISSVTSNGMHDFGGDFDDIDVDDDMTPETINVVSPAFPDHPNMYNSHLNVVTPDNGNAPAFFAPPIDGVQGYEMHEMLDLDAILGPPTLNEANFHFHHGNGRRDKKRTRIVRKYKSRRAAPAKRAATRKGKGSSRGKATQRSRRAGKGKGKGKGTGNGISTYKKRR
jgi:hypothetical protein